VVRAPERPADVAGAVGDDHGALVRAPVHQHVQRTVLVTHEDERAARDLHGEVVTRPRDLGGVADVDPRPREQSLLLEGVELLAQVQVAMHAIRFDKRPDRRWVAAVGDHRLVLARV
jgi:hypothetical protein